MVSKSKGKILVWLFLAVCSIPLITNLTSCGKAGTQNAASLNIRYEILNLSPDLYPVNLFIDYHQVNALNNPFVFNINHGYFYVPSVDTPYQFRSNQTTGLTLFSRHDILKPHLTYSLFIVGSLSNHTLTQIFTVDTATAPAFGKGKIRFVDASPTGTNGLDLSANGTKAFTGLVYPNYSKFIELPVGSYDFQINSTGSSAVLKDLPGVTIQDGKLYTIYAYGYTTRIDSAAFNAAVITNR